jgi:hypothetical protein
MRGPIGGGARGGGGGGSQIHRAESQVCVYGEGAGQAAGPPPRRAHPPGPIEPGGPTLRSRSRDPHRSRRQSMPVPGLRCGGRLAASRPGSAQWRRWRSTSACAFCAAITTCCRSSRSFTPLFVCHTGRGGGEPAMCGGARTASLRDTFFAEAWCRPTERHTKKRDPANPARPSSGARRCGCRARPYVAAFAARPMGFLCGPPTPTHPTPLPASPKTSTLFIVPCETPDNPPITPRCANVYVQLGGNLESAGPVWRVYCSLYWQWVQMSRRTSASRRPRIHLNGAQPSLKNRSSQLHDCRRWAGARRTR